MTMLCENVNEPYGFYNSGGGGGGVGTVKFQSQRNTYPVVSLHFYLYQSVMNLPPPKKKKKKTKQNSPNGEGNLRLFWSWANEIRVSQSR